jgi:hypothetical protein
MSKEDIILVEELFQRTLLQYDRIFTGEPAIGLELVHEPLPDVSLSCASCQNAKLFVAENGRDLQGEQRVSALSLPKIERGG